MPELGCASVLGPKMTVTDTANDVLALNNVALSLLKHDASNVFKSIKPRFSLRENCK